MIFTYTCRVRRVKILEVELNFSLWASSVNFFMPALQSTNDKWSYFHSHHGDCWYFASTYLGPDNMLRILHASWY